MTNDSSSYNTDRNNLVAWYRMGETDSGTGTYH